MTSPALAAGQAASPSAGFDVFVSSDADHSNALKLGLSFDFIRSDSEHYQGVRVETFFFSSKGVSAIRQERGYYEFAGTAERWKWNGTVGTDGNTVLGSGSLYTEETFRQEYFVSRDMVETPLGVRQHLYFTFAGAAYDMQLDDRNTLTALVGTQAFSGGNDRLHLRARYIYSIEPDWGLSVQLRSRYFLNSEPHEFDYFSPRWYFETIPTIQLRRFYSRWQYSAAFGWGIQRDAGSDWRSARLVEASIVSPKFGLDWSVKIGASYSNTPTAAGSAYSYEHATLSLVKNL